MSKKKREIEPEFVEVDQPVKQKMSMRVVRNTSFFKENDYIFDDRFHPGDGKEFISVHSVPEMISCLEKNKNVDADGVFLEANSRGEYRYVRLNKEKILEHWKKNSQLRKLRECKVRVSGRFKESSEAKLKEDSFASDNPPSSAGTNSGLVGDDFVPLLGGPFNKQPYLYDYLRAHAYCFHEYHHHPLARAIVHITRDFVLGGGYTIDCDDKKALALWRAFEVANKFEEMVEYIVEEGSWSGETMLWWLPNQQSYIEYQDAPSQKSEKVSIPRVRMMDPSTCWEIVTYPEDITRVLFYWFLFPTQYQIKTGQANGAPVPTAKFINQQIPASDLMHFKYNCASNEKRGRSDLFPALGYLKWVRDLTNYRLIAAKKQAAWTEDITVEGAQTDVDNLTASLDALGEFEPAGSRFVHTSKIKREYLENKSGTTKDEALEMGVSMVAAAVQIPVSYFGLAISTGQTRASALVGTEPVAKKMQRRQNETKRVIQAVWRRFQDNYGVKGADCSITFPEIITQDRSAKLKDTKFVEDCGYISRETAAPIAAKELGIDDYDYNQERVKIQAENPQPIEPTLGSPLTAPGIASGGGSGSQGSGVGSQPSGTSSDQTQKPSAVTKDDRRSVNLSKG